MKFIRSYYRKFKAEREHSRALNRSTSGSDPDWKEARINLLLVKYEEGFIGKNTLLGELHWDWCISGLDYVIDVLLNKQRGVKPEITYLATELMRIRSDRDEEARKARQQHQNKLEQEKFDLMIGKLKLEEEAAKFDNSAFINFLEQR